MISITKIAALTPPFYVRKIERLITSAFAVSDIDAEIAANCSRIKSFNTRVDHYILCSPVGFGVSSRFYDLLLEGGQRTNNAAFASKGIDGEFVSKMAKIEMENEPGYEAEFNCVFINGKPEIKGIEI